jgi:hypothetical protein
MDKVYVGKGKIGKFDQIKIGLSCEKLKPNAKGYVNLIVAPMREKDKYDNTHTVYVDDWQPSQSKEERAIKDNPESGDLPF